MMSSSRCLPPSLSLIPSPSAALSSSTLSPSLRVWLLLISHVAPTFCCHNNKPWLFREEINKCNFALNLTCPCPLLFKVCKKKTQQMKVEMLRRPSGWRCNHSKRPCRWSVTRSSTLKTSKSRAPPIGTLAWLEPNKQGYDWVYKWFATQTATHEWLLVKWVNIFFPVKCDDLFKN